MPLISSVTVASFAGVRAANPAGRANPATTSPRPNSDILLFISTTSGADYTTWAIRRNCILAERHEIPYSNQSRDGKSCNL